MDYQKLLFAAEVRRVAHEYRVSGRQIHLHSLAGTKHDAAEEVRRFDTEHPFANYVQDAYHDILNVVRQVEAFENAGQK